MEFSYRHRLFYMWLFWSLTPCIIKIQIEVVSKAKMTEREVRKAVLELVRHRYLATYAGYLPSVHKNNGKHLIPDLHFIGDTMKWIETRDKIVHEEKCHLECTKYGGCGSSLVASGTPTIDIIRKSCGILRINYDIARYSIEQYTDTEKCMHCTVAVLIRTCNWVALGRQLSQDIENLPDVFGGIERKLMSQAIESIQDRYFDRSDRSGHPIANKHALDLDGARLERFRAQVPARKVRESEARGRVVSESTLPQSNENRGNASPAKFPTSGNECVIRAGTTPNLNMWGIYRDDFRLIDLNFKRIETDDEVSCSECGRVLVEMA